MKAEDHWDAFRGGNLFASNWYFFGDLKSLFWVQECSEAVRLKWIALLS